MTVSSSKEKVMILIGALEFDGPQEDVDMLSDEPGIYAFLSEHAGEFELVELGEAESLREYIQSHTDRLTWLENGMHVSFAVHYTSDLDTKERVEILQDLEREFADEQEVACA
jgi:hypothetical protein